MKQILFTCFTCMCLLWVCSAHAQSKTVTLNKSNVPLTAILDEIETQSGYLFLYNKQVVGVDRAASLNVTKAPLTDALEKLFAGTDIAYTIKGQQIVLTKRETAAKGEPQNRRRTGPCAGPENQGTNRRCDGDRRRDHQGNHDRFAGPVPDRRQQKPRTQHLLHRLHDTDRTRRGGDRNRGIPNRRCQAGRRSGCRGLRHGVTPQPDHGHRAGEARRRAESREQQHLADAAGTRRRSPGHGQQFAARR